MQLDRTERVMLQVRHTGGGISWVELGDGGCRAVSRCFRRVKRLEESGLIQGYAARLDQRQLGLQVTAFVQVSLDQQDDRKQRDFLTRVEAEEHIVECHAMSGSHDFLLKVLAYSMDHFSELSMQRILKFPGVKNMESNFSLMAIKQSAAMPVR